MKNFFWLIVFCVVVIGLGVLILLPEVVNGPEYVRQEPLPLDDEMLMEELTLTSTAFADRESIPAKYTCDGDNISPPLSISGVSEDAESLVLIMDDPDIPDSVKEERGIEVFDHWVVFNIPPETTTIFEGQEPDGVLGRNSRDSTGYIGSCLPDGEHRYYFKLYSLDRMLNLEERATKGDVEEAMRGHILQETQLLGRYERNQ